MAASIPIPAIPAVSKAVERLIGPTLEGWWAAFRSDVEGWLTWKDLGTVLFGAAFGCYVIYLFTSLLIEKAAEKLDTRYPAAWAQRIIQAAVALVCLPLLIWTGLMLARPDGGWNWNAPVFGTPLASQPPVDNGAIAPRARDAEAIPPAPPPPEGVSVEEWVELWKYATDEERALWQ